MRFLLIDADVDYRRVLRYHLSTAWPDATIDEYAPEARSGAALAGNWVGAIDEYDALLLGYPRAAALGERWLAELVSRSECPPVIVFADPSDEFLAVDALQAGAASYFPKRKVKHARLVEAMAYAIATANRSVGASIGAQSWRGTQTSLGSQSWRGLHAPLASDTSISDFVPTSLRNAYEIIRELHSTDIATVCLAKSPSSDGSKRMKPMLVPKAISPVRNR